VPVLWAEQRHGTTSFVYGQHAPLPVAAHCVGQCDAIITAEPHVALLVLTADCLPVALVGEEVVAIVHAGWRGLAADILGAVLRRIGNEFGVSPGQLTAILGVGVGPCHYPVGTEVREALAVHPVAWSDWSVDGAVDLSRWAAGRLLALGVPPGGVLRLAGCTACSDRYHSYRRDGAGAGRQWSAVVLTPR